MKKVVIQLEVELPDDYNESEVDTALADLMDELGGQVLDSKEFVEMKEDNLTLRQKVNSLTEDILGEVQHGECFYRKDMLNDFLKNLDELKRVSKKYYESNQEEDKE